MNGLIWSFPDSLQTGHSVSQNGTHTNLVRRSRKKEKKVLCVRVRVCTQGLPSFPCALTVLRCGDILPFLLPLLLSGFEKKKRISLLAAFQAPGQKSLSFWMGGSGWFTRACVRACAGFPMGGWAPSFLAERSSSSSIIERTRKGSIYLSSSSFLSKRGKERRTVKRF